MHPLETFVSSLSIGSPTTVEGLSVFPLLREGAGEPFYDTLSDAIGAGTLRISEVSDAGHVPELRVVNDGARPVLLVDGEELIGAKQNRIVNLTVLVPASSTLTLPVTCVEAGRWRHVSDEFASAERAFHASGRRDKLDQVSFSLAAHRRPVANQSAVWSEIADKSARMGARSETAAAAAMYEHRRDQLDRMIKSIAPVPGQVGAVFTIRGAIAGLDVFDSPKTWRRTMPKLMRSYGLDALDGAIGGDGAAAPEPGRFLQGVAQATCTTYKGVGDGQDLRFEGNGLIGAALDTHMGVVHAVAFPASEAGRGPADSLRDRYRRAGRGYDEGA